MLRKRLIPCLDVRDGVVVKGVKFANHVVMGDIVDLAKRYRDAGADELVFYDIKASTVGATVDRRWIERVAAVADKVSVNSRALARPELIGELAASLGSQSVVVGVDSRFVDDDWYVFQ